MASERISERLIDITEQLKRHALITALAGSSKPAAQRVALLLATANAAGDEAGFTDALTYIPEI